MSMKIQAACSNCCEGIKEFALAAGAWIGRTVTTAGAFITEGARKAATFAKPYFEQLKTFAQENKQPIVIAAVGFTLGAVAHAVINYVFCKNTSSASSRQPTGLDPSGQPASSNPSRQPEQQSA